MKVNKITNKSNRSVLATAIIIIIIIGGIVYGTRGLLNKYTYDVIVKTMDEMAEHDMKNIREQVQDQWNTMDGFRTYLEKTEPQSAWEYQKELSLRSSVKSYQHMYLIDEAGGLYSDAFDYLPPELNMLSEYFATGKEHFVVRYSGNDYFQDADRGYIVYGYNFEDKPLAIPGTDNHFVKVAVLEDMAFIQDRMRITSFEGRGFSNVIGRNGFYIVTDSGYTGKDDSLSFFERLAASRVEGEKSAEELIADVRAYIPTGFWCTTEDGVRKFVSVRPLGDLGWSFVTAVEEEAFARQTGKLVLLVGSMLAVLLSLLTILFASVYAMYRKNQTFYFDAAGEVYNKLYYTERLAETEMVALAIADMDHLKTVNDTYGHLIGDWAIRECARVVSQTVGKRGLTVRFGGDEFVILVRDAMPEEEFLEMLRTMQEEIHKVRHENLPNLRLTFSIGGFYGKGLAQDLLRRADQCLYQAKVHRDRVVTNQDSTEENQEKLNALEAEKVRRDKVLVVDDSKMNRMTLQRLLEDNYDVETVTNGMEALELLRDHVGDYSCMLLDILMPLMDGFEVLEAMGQMHWVENLPVIVISGEDSQNFMQKAYELGAVDYINRPFDAAIVRRRVENTIRLYGRQRKLSMLAAEQIYKQETISRLLVGIMSHVLGQHNGEDGNHVWNIELLTELLAKGLIERTDRYPMSREDLQLLCDAAAIHDIGKIGIPKELLNKSGPLTEGEYEMMKEHSALGEEILSSLVYGKEEPLIQVAKEVCRWHHEQWDGSGYPDGLRGDQIPITAQIVSLADVYDGLTSSRGGQRAFTHEEAVSMILAGECGSFNPLLIATFEEIQENIGQTLRGNTQDFQKNRNVQRVVENLLRQEGLPLTNSVMQLLEHEKEIYEFYNQVSSDICFEQLLSPPVLLLSELDSRRLGVPTVIPNPLEDERYLGVLGSEVFRRLQESLKTTTREKCEFTVEGQLRLPGGVTECRIACRVIWDKEHRGHRVSVIGKIMELCSGKEAADECKGML